ncbi:hypothetical protein CIPAW_02G087200 [Carya illinoinensis]|uniref:Protein kinase domain-containing protein n=1 Tax=Carya illinoinensis TaxID=32201 RepID=A0A8T1RA54_CARIL|nr:hypothetical protein CIPAW_02G087200 [Carya illinoinensis]
MDHPNVLKFYSWYEASANLWLVLEEIRWPYYGRIVNYLKIQFMILPGPCQSLAVLHSKGIIYCDLKPSNILLDENGRTKLCDFGLARKLSDISKTPSSSLPQAKRGTPFYMAPELFDDEGVHSYASDFWALGCVLYECYTGRPPFVEKEFTQLVKSILSDPTPPLPGNPSRPFVNLINSLLVKDPAERIQWTELCGHDFWRTKITLVPLPPQLAFDNMIELSTKPCLLERNGDKSLQNKIPPKHHVKDVKGALKQDNNSILESRGRETPVKGMSRGGRTQIKVSGRVVDEKQKDPPKTTRGFNLLRLSRIANTSSTPGDKFSSQDHYQGKMEEIENKTPPFGSPPVVNTPAADEPKTPDGDSSAEHIEEAVPPSSVSPQLKLQRIGEGSGSVLDSDSTKASNNISQVLWHPSDLSVRPVMPSRKDNKLTEVIPSLPFEALQASDFARMPKEKQNVIRYLETLSSNADASNILTNGPIMLLVKMLRQSKASALRVQLASLVGLLIRHLTFIEDDLANSGILGSLADGLRDKQEKVRRLSMAALGEFLFYISTQNDHSRNNNPPESPSKDTKSTSGWQVLNTLISLVSSILRKGEDDVTQPCALRTTENISSQGRQWAARFTSQDVIRKQESIRLSAGSCLVRLVHFSPANIELVTERLSFKDIVSGLLKGTPREQQISLNLLNMAMLEAIYRNLFPGLVSLIEQGSEVLKGKTLIFVAFLCKNGRKWLPHFLCNAKLLSAVDRLAKDKGNFVRQCLDAFVNVVAATIPGLLDTITLDIQQMIGGTRHGHISAFSSRAAPKTNVHMFPIVLHLLGSSSFERKVVDHQLLQQLTNLSKLVESPFQSVTEEPPTILENPIMFVRKILPSLIVLYKGKKDGNARFSCLKLLFDIILIFLNEPFDEQRSEDLMSISNAHFLPLYPTLIEDEDPIPMYAQKLLVMFIEFNYIKISDILHQKTISQCLHFLPGDLSFANVNNVKLCLALTSALEMESKLLSQLKVVGSIGNLLEFVCAKNMEDFLEPTLGLCRAFLLRSTSSRKGFYYSKEPDLLSDGIAETKGATDQQQSISDIMDFGSNVGVFLELSGYHETNVADIAYECIGHLSLVLRMLHALSYSCRQYLSEAMILSISIPEISRTEAIVSELKSSAMPDLANAASIVALELQRLPRCI